MISAIANSSAQAVAFRRGKQRRRMFDQRRHETDLDRAIPLDSRHVRIDPEHDATRKPGDEKGIVGTVPKAEIPVLID